MTTKREYAQDLLVLYFRGLYRDTSSELPYNEDEIRDIVNYIFDGVLEEITALKAAESRIPATPATGTVAALRRALEGLDGEMRVVLCRDAEGNGYCPLGKVEVMYYSPEDREACTQSAFNEYGHSGYPDAVPALVLWPAG